jgi:hypothetical protein
MAYMVVKLLKIGNAAIKIRGNHNLTNPILL